MAARKTSRSSTARRAQAADKKTRASGSNNVTTPALTPKAEDLPRKMEALPEVPLEDEGLFANLYNFAPVAFVTFNSFGIVTGLNLAAVSLLGRSRQHVVGAPLAVHLERGSLGPFLNHLRRCKEGESQVVTELEVRRLEGHLVPVQLITTPLPFSPQCQLPAYQGVLVDLTAQKALEQQILEIGESDRRRMGQDLHDGLGQQITGIIFHAHLLQKQLANKSLKEAETAQQIVTLLNEAKIQARHIARGLQPVDPAPNGLMAGLDHFASTTSELYRIECRFLCPEPVMLSDHTMAVHLFRITQEAVSNAFRHGGARKIEIHLRTTNDELVLEVVDHGCGLPKGADRQDGLGLRFMKYRAETIGGTFDIRRRPGGGTMVRCRVRNHARLHET